MVTRPLGQWQGEPVEHWRAAWGVPMLQAFARVGSTNDVARELAGRGAEAGTVVVADEQAEGRGRRGRSWTAYAGSSLLLSMVLRPASGSEPLLSLRLGLAAARAVEHAVPVEVLLKWPNDLVAGGGKVAGILCEGSVDRGRTAFVVAGVGINLTQQDDDWPPTLRGSATSLAAATGRAVAPADLAGRVVQEWLAAAALQEPALSPDELGELERRDALRGRPVAVDGEPAGVAEGVAPDGALRVRRDGVARRIVHGTVRVLERKGATG